MHYFSEQIRLFLSILILIQVSSDVQPTTFQTRPGSLALRRRRKGIPPRHDCTPNSRKLSDLEEHAIIQYALDVDTRGFQLNLDILRDIANKLLLDRRSATKVQGLYRLAR